MRTRAKRISAVVLALVIAGGLTACAQPVSPATSARGSASATPIVLEVNGAAITENELRHCAQLERAVVYDEVAREYGLNDSADYWSTKIGSTTPGALLVNRATARCTETAVRRERAVTLGLIDDERFSAVVQRLNTLNAQRQLSFENGEVLYGPIEYSLVDFENKELADFASVEERATAQALATNLALLNAYVAESAELAAETDSDRAHQIAAQMLARERVDTSIAEAVDSAIVTKNSRWFDTVDVESFLTATEMIEPEEEGNS